ncbi:hypothetical protein [Nakamurella lactea]|uniref:hypothetical protein n=1 Tax=Nakamurella lactea TaxID=459515 RepID=UPI0004184D5E|nr:hypothetical protein [Nakamurella lactea]
MSLVTSYEFTLPRGYVDPQGGVHRVGTMRLATARDELEPLRDPTVSGADDPRLTVLILARVVQKLGTLDQVTPHEIEGLFAADLAFLQDFYGVINFGNQQEYEALLAAQAQSPPLTGAGPTPAPSGPTDVPAGTDPVNGSATGTADADAAVAPEVGRPRPRVEEIPRQQG